MNLSDSERICAILEHLGFEKTEEISSADLIIFNTCSVRQKAEDKVHGMIGNALTLKRKNPQLLLAVTGCMIRKSSTQNSEKRDKLLKLYNKLDFVFRIEDLGVIDKLLFEIVPDLDLNIMADEGTLENYFKIYPKYTENFKAYVPIQTGCDKFCTYCIVPYSRGREKSRNFEEIIKECEQLVSEGVKEITLLGQTVNTYGISRADKISKNFEKYGDFPFVALLKKINALQAKGLKWLRFASPYPKDFSDELITAMSELETVCPHAHMPIQAGSDEMLKAMNRKYSVAEYIKLVAKFRKKIPNISITTDIIVGFCGETEEMFEKTCSLYKKIKWDMCYPARYSPRIGTFSEKQLKDDVLREEKAKRWRKLNNLIKKYCFESMKKFLNKEEEVLIDEKKADGFYYAHNAHNKIIRLKLRTNLIGKFAYVKIKEVKEWLMEGELMENNK